MVCIQTGKSIQDTNRMKFQGSDFYVKSYDQMFRVFKDSPEVLSRTLSIAERCSLRLEKVRNFSVKNSPGFPDRTAQTVEKTKE